ncbi:MAG: hypothetical protein PHI22_03735 [Bacilli bacterium]|nr:hypothetical protein [Bacilli bacterium]
MKVFIISHISDPDGVVPVILSRLVFDEVKSTLVNADDVNDILLKLINNNEFDKYDVVYITDLSPNKKMCELINNDSILKSKIKIFDHHIGNMFANQYSFATIIDTDEEGIKQSGTSLYYEHLLKTYDNKHLNKEAVRSFVDLVRSFDTWEWTKTNNLDAKKITNLFDIYGHEYFEEHYLKFLKENDTFYFDDKELFLLETEQIRIDTYVKEKKDKIIPVSLLDYNAGIVFSSKYRSELGDRLAKHFKDKYDFIVLIDLERSISYKGIKNVDLNQISQVFGGKGHINSSGSPLPIDLQEQIIKIIFGDKITINNYNDF